MVPVASTVLSIHPDESLDGTASTSASRGLSEAEQRHLLAAREDAATFIATRGQRRSPAGGAALWVLRRLPVLAEQGDLQRAWQVRVYPRAEAVDTALAQR